MLLVYSSFDTMRIMSLVEVQGVIAKVLLWVALIAVSAPGVYCADDSVDRTEDGGERGANSKLAVKVEVGSCYSLISLLARSGLD